MDDFSVAFLFNAPQSELAVKAGRKIKLIFANPDFMPHNIVHVNPGKLEAIAMQAMTLGTNGFKVGFVPESCDILWASKLLDHGKEETIEFTAPRKPYACNFPATSSSCEACYMLDKISDHSSVNSPVPNLGASIESIQILASIISILVHMSSYLPLV